MFGLNAARQVISTKGLTSYGLGHDVPNGDFEGPMLLVSTPTFTSSYLTAGGGFPGDADLTPTGFGDPAVARDVATVLGLDLSDEAGTTGADDWVGSAWELLAEAQLLDGARSLRTT